ncbi:MAG: agmatine deiminase family protein [Bacteroidota bacterium]
MIAEWENQSRVLFSFPKRDGDWGHQLEAASLEMTNLITTTARFVPVTVVCGDMEWVSKYIRIDNSFDLKGPGPSKSKIQLFDLPTNDCWIRDFGPISQQVGERILLHDFRFNGWGQKFEAEADNRVSARLWATGILGDSAMQSHATVLEGGSLETDGQGTLLTTEKCLLNPNRNLHLTKTEITRLLKDQLGFKRIVWLKHGELIGDDTDAHIDTLVRFCNPKTLAYTCSTDPDDPHFDSLQAMERELQVAFPEHHLIPLPLPTPVFAEDDGQRLPATYANFLLTNGAVIVPTYGLPTDAQAMGILADVFSDRELIPLSSRALVHQHGSFHCLSCNLY